MHTETRGGLAWLLALIFFSGIPPFTVATPVPPSPDDIAYQKAAAALKSGDAAQIAKVEEGIRNDAKAGNASNVDLRVLNAMTSLGMGKEAAAICGAGQGYIQSLKGQK